MVFWSTDIKIKVHSGLQASKSLLRYRSSILECHWKPWSKPLHPTTASSLGVFIKAEVLVGPSGWAFLISIQCPDHINPPGLVQKPTRAGQLGSAPVSHVPPLSNNSAELTWGRRETPVQSLALSEFIQMPGERYPHQGLLSVTPTFCNHSTLYNLFRVCQSGHFCLT